MVAAASVEVAEKARCMRCGNKFTPPKDQPVGPLCPTCALVASQSTDSAAWSRLTGEEDQQVSWLQRLIDGIMGRNY
eukprot:g68406.t1